MIDMTHFKRFEENYIAIQEPAKNQRGFRVKYIYYGPYYRFLDGATSLCRSKHLLTGFLILSILSFLFASFLDTELNYSSLVGTPAAIAFIPLLFETIATVHLCCASEKITRPTFSFIRHILLVAPVCRFVTHIITVCTCVAMLFQSSTASNRDLIATASYAFAALCAVLEAQRFRAIPFTSEKNPALDDYDDIILRGHH